MILRDLLGKNRAPTGDLGLEIEMEGIPLPPSVDGWNYVPDGSLREGGVEYVLSKPESLEDTKRLISELTEALLDNGKNPVFSFRTSVHVHVNCMRMTYHQILNYILLYYLLEQGLTEYCGEGRKANRFCLRLFDAEGIVFNAEQLFRTSRPQRAIASLSVDASKYAALNLSSLRTFGSLEFRSMRGTLDTNVLFPWLETLLHMREYSLKFKVPMEILDRIDEIGEEEFIKEALGDNYSLFIDRSLQEIALSRSLTVDLPIQVKKEYKERKLPLELEVDIGFGPITIQEIIDVYEGNVPPVIMRAIDNYLEENGY